MSSSETVVLIIEQDDPTRDLYLRELSRNFRAVSYANGSEALTFLHTHTVQAIVLEPAQADGQGWDLLRDIRTQLNRQPVPIVLCSTLDERRRGMDLGATAYLIKPVLPATLLDTLQQVIKPTVERAG